MVRSILSFAPNPNRRLWRFLLPVIRPCSHCGKQNRVPAKFLASSGRCGFCKYLLPPVAEPLAVDDQLFDEIVQNSPVPVLVDFWAGWCRPCVAAAPEVARTAANMAGRAVVLKVDTEKYPQVAGRFQVSSIPNFVVLLGGRTVTQQAGLADHNQMERWLKSAAAVSA
jgi:thioredoxin 2